MRPDQFYSLVDRLQDSTSEMAFSPQTLEKLAVLCGSIDDSHKLITLPGLLVSRPRCSAVHDAPRHGSSVSRAPPRLLTGIVAMLTAHCFREVAALRERTITRESKGRSARRNP